jgi:hypothetical protein
MSAFVVDTDTMDRCVRAICARGKYGQVIPHFAGLDTSKPNSLTDIGRRLYTLNVEAVQQRYPDTIDSPDDMPGPIEPIPAAQLPHRYTHTQGKHVIDFDAAVGCLKSLHCLQYQCTEGDADESGIFAELSKAIGTFADHLIQSLPAYERAPWG